MLPQHLVTNEVKDNLGNEVEFYRVNNAERLVEFAKSGENYNLPCRIRLGHTYIGTGLLARRRSVLRVDNAVTGGTDAMKKANIAMYTVADIPVGNLTSNTAVKIALAYLMSLLASQGASTTILYDGSGYGADGLINGIL